MRAEANVKGAKSMSGRYIELANYRESKIFTPPISKTKWF